jgi:uncharacterized repeat protein (TIGR01451 family)
LFAQVTAWEDALPDFPIRHHINDYTQHRKFRPRDSSGNEWDVVNNKLCRINGQDTLFYNDSPITYHANLISYAQSSSEAHNYRKVEIGPGNEIVFVVNTADDANGTNRKSFLGVFSDGKYTNYELTQMMGAVALIYVTEKRVYMYDYRKMIYFDFETKLLNKLDLYETNDRYINGILTDDSTFLFGLDNDRLPYVIRDSDNKWNILMYSPVIDYRNLSDGTVVFVNKSESGKIYTYGRNGLNELLLRENLGQFQRMVRSKDDDLYLIYEQGVVYKNDDKLYEYKFQDVRADFAYVPYLILQDNGVELLGHFEEKRRMLSNFKSNLNLVRHFEFKQPTINGFYKEQNGDEFVYFINVKDSVNTDRVLYEVKNGTDTTRIILPEANTRYNYLLLSFDYIWISFRDKSGKTQVKRLARDRKGLIQGHIFYDGNKNGIYDSDESGVGNYPVVVKPSGLKIIPSESGEFLFTGDRDSIYTLEFPDADLFDYASVQFPYIFNNSATNLIGVTLKNPIAIINSAFVVPRSRCSVKSYAILPVVNAGFADAEKIRITIKGNDLAKLSLEENSSHAEGNILEFEITDLKVKASQNLSYFIEWASGEFTGKFAEFNLKLEVYKDNSVISVIQDTISSEIRCSWDPNDMAVTPAGVEDLHYTKMNSTLSYLVRFENTGNDTAYTVAVYDTLDANLDYSTLKVIGSSHPVQTEINKDKVVFRFENIMLPDAKTDKEKAQGFVRFSVKPKSDLSEYTVIRNKAGIVFDMNTPVITNEVFNTMGDSPVTLAVTSEDADYGFSVYPNPAIDVISVKGKDIAEVEIVDIYGIVQLETHETDIDISSFEPGVYFVKTKGVEGQKIGQKRFVKVD